MEKYTVSRKLAEKLKEAGYPQNSTEFNWVITMTTNWHLSWYPGGELPNDIEALAAPMSDEIMEQLKALEPTLRWADTATADEFHRVRPEILDKYMAFTAAMRFGDYPYAITAPDALAKLWLYCKEHNLLGGEEA